MKIAVVAPMRVPVSDRNPHGNPPLVADLARGLARRGHQVWLLAPEGSQCPDTMVVPITAALRRQRLEAASRVLEDLAPDAVSQHACDALALDRFGGSHVLHTLHAPPRGDAAVAAAGRAEGILASGSRSGARVWEAALGRHVLCIPHGVPEEVGLPAPSPAVGSEPFVLLAGRIARARGMAAGLEAARLCGLHAVIAGEADRRASGDGEGASQLAGATRLGVLPRATVRALMGRAACTLLPAAADGLSEVVAAESLLAGTPVVGTRRGALPEIVVEGRDGLLVAEPDPPALAAALHDALALDRMVIARDARPRLGMEPCLDAYERTLAALARGPHGRTG